MLITLLILIFIRPFISSLAFPYINSIYSIILLSFLAIWIIFKGVSLKAIGPIKYQLIVFILAVFISLIFSQGKATSIKELYKYITGIVLLLLSASLVHKDRKQVILCMVASGLLISVLAIYQYFFGFRHLLGYITKQGITDPFVLDYVSRRRVFFPFVTPNVLAGYLAMIIPLTLIYKQRISLLIPLSLALLLTRSVGGLLSLFFGLVIYFYLPRPCVQERSLQGKLEKRKVILLVGLLIAIVGVLIVRYATPKQHIQPIFSAIMRLNYWQDTLRIIKAHLLTGVGLGNFNLVYARFAHNSYLQIWAEMGILGIISFLWLITALFKSAGQAHPLIAASIVFLTHNLIDFTFFLPEVGLIWWVISGLMLSSYLQAEPLP